MKYVIFTLNDKVYGINIVQVSEVIRMRKITPVPDTADFVEGVASIRGKIITILNLTKKLHFSNKKAEKSDRIIVSNLSGHLVGLIVNSVSGVVDFNKADIITPDETLKDAGYLIGMAKQADRLVLLADAEKFLTKDIKEDMAKIKNRIEVKPKGNK